ncbi:hypothetical protein TRFO_29080 [Tritrichomonas foetus]|uniref:Uncharacterized protein n=1 Tax=Tritrichomonas foetus TaxID=1144522 RepID=A0A1J4K1A0_9EUKA|nr:hypothetical protein TRFO_29080 [Tritrichomonas foetus]|eukprot:OHT03526.1 hypothetical protein TRFO_29080 [Tritrichomonas foetus]
MNEPNLVELQHIFRACIHKSEMMLHQIRKDRYHQSHGLISAFYKIQIMICRLLILFRWKKRSTSHHLKIKMDQQHFLQFSMPPFIPFKPLPKFSVAVFEPKILENVATELSVYSFVQSLYSMFFSFHVLSLKISPKHFIIKTKEFIIYANIKSNKKVEIRKIDIRWPECFSQNIKDEMYKKIIGSLIRKNLEFSFTNFERFCEIANLIHNIYLIGQFTFIVNEISKYKQDFSFEILYKNEMEVEILFPEGFRPYNRFRLSLTNNRIIFRSLSTLYIADPETAYAEYSKRTSEDQSPLVLRKFFEFAFIEFCPSNIQEVITKVRDYLVYTRLMIAFGMLQRSMISMPFLNIVIELICHAPSISCSFIIISLSNIPRISLCVDQRSGDILFRNLEPSHYDLSAFAHCFDDDGAEVLRFLQYFIISRIINFHFQVLGPHFGILNISKCFTMQDYRRWCFFMTLSFAPDFQAVFIIRPGSPDYYVMTKDYKLIKSKKLTEYMNINSIRRTITDAVTCNKVLLVSLQLEKELHNIGCKVKRHEGRMTIFMKPLIKVQLKIKADGHWSLAFHRQHYPFSQAGILTITGSKFTCRMALRLINIIDGVTSNRALMRNASTMCGAEFSIEHDLSATLSVGGYHINMSMSPFSDYFTMGACGYFVSNSFSPLILLADFNRSFPLPLNWMFDNIDTFGSFLHSSLPPLIKFKEVMNYEGWTTSYLSATDSFYLVYKERVTLNIQMKPLQCFAVVIPNFGVSSLLQIPLSIFPKFYRLIKLTHHTYKVHLTELVTLRERVSSFCEDFAVLSKGGFRFTKILEPSKAAVMIPYHSNMPFNIVVYLEATNITVSCDDAPIIPKLFTKLGKIFQENRLMFRRGMRLFCHILKCDQIVALSAFRIVRECLKKKWCQEMIWQKFFSYTKVDLESDNFQCTIQTRSYHTFVDVAKQAYQPVITVLHQSNEQKVFTNVESFCEWFKHESPLGSLVF